MNLVPVSLSDLGWSDGAMVLGKLSVPTCPTSLENRWERPIALAVGAGRGCLDIVFFLLSIFFLFFLPVWVTVRYRLKYCLKGPLNPKQPINNSIDYTTLRFIYGTNLCLPLRITIRVQYISGLENCRFFLRRRIKSISDMYKSIQSTLVISTLVISNNRLSRRENLIL